MEQNIFQFITSEEANFKTARVPVTSNKEWNMYEHIQRCTNVTFGWFHRGADDGNRPYKNIVTPILNVARRSEGFDVKDIEPYVDDSDNYYKSFFFRKFHPRWARKNGVDESIDDSVESQIVYGLSLMKDSGKNPEVIPLQTIAFCDQTNIMSGPICIRHEWSIQDLLDKKGVWNDEKIMEAITHARAEKANTADKNDKSKTPGKYIEGYELHGTLPKEWLDDEKSDEYVGQMQIITFYTDSNNKKQGIKLFKGKEKKSPFKAKVINKVHGRACGQSIVESLFEDQVWTNYNEIKIKAMLDTAALILLQTADQGFKNRNNLKNLEAGVPEVLEVADGKQVTQLNGQPANIPAFNDAVSRWNSHAQVLGSASDAQLGVNPTSGTPFALQNLVVQQGEGIHEWRQGKMADFWEEIYRDWVLKYLVDDINQGQKWMERLDMKEMNEILENILTKEANNRIKEGMFKNNGKGGELVTAEMVESRKQMIREEFKKNPNKAFEIIKGELEGLPTDVQINIKGKQKNMYKVVDSLVNVFRQVLANPQSLQQPGMADLFNEIIENSGLSPIDFSGLSTPMMAQPQQNTRAELNADNLQTNNQK
ncbi:MAG: hypothetical protein WCQ96_03060 [Patescibacteria group bacterium]